MKNIIKLLTISILFVAFTGCDEELDRTTFDGDGTFLSFVSSNPSSVAINVDETMNVDLAISVSTLSNSDRTYTIDLDVDATTANMSNFTLPTSVTIPSGSYFGNFTMVVTDNDDLGSESKNIVFSLGGVDNVSMDSNITSISIFEVCPVPTSFFTGMYLMEQVSAELDGPTLSTGTVVEVTVDESSDLRRTFETENFPDYCSGTFLPFVVDLLCNEMVVPSQNNNCACADGTGYFGTADTNETYSLTDGDDVIFISFADDVLNDCGPTGTTTYRFTKQ